MRKAIYCFLLIVICALYSCEEYEMPERSLSTSSNKLALEADQMYDLVYVTSNGNWEIKSDDAGAWVTISPSKGMGSMSVTIKADKNLEQRERSASFTVKCEDKVNEILISQAAARDTVHLEYYEEGFSCEGGSSTLEIYSNTSWSATTNDSWLSISKHEGNMNGSITITAEAKPAAGDRKGTICFSYPNGEDVILDVWQYENSYLLSELNDANIPQDEVLIIRDEFITIESLSDAHYLSRKSVKFINLKSIPDGAFYTSSRCPNYIYAPKVKKIGVAAFNQTHLYGIDMPMVEEIGTQAFVLCYNLQSVNFRNVKLVKQLAFDGSMITEADFPNVEVIEKGAFLSCSELQRINMPKLTIVGDRAFRLCGALVDISLPSAIEIGDSAFDYCSSLNTLTIDNVKILQSNFIGNCSSLQHLEMATKSSFVSIGVINLPSQTINLTTSLGSKSGSNGWNIYGNIFSPFNSVNIVNNEK